MASSRPSRSWSERWPAQRSLRSATRSTSAALSIGWCCSSSPPARPWRTPKRLARWRRRCAGRRRRTRGTAVARGVSPPLHGPRHALSDLRSAGRRLLAPVRDALKRAAILREPARCPRGAAHGLALAAATVGALPRAALRATGARRVRRKARAAALAQLAEQPRAAVGGHGAALVRHAALRATAGRFTHAAAALERRATRFTRRDAARRAAQPGDALALTAARAVVARASGHSARRGATHAADTRRALAAVSVRQAPFARHAAPAAGTAPGQAASGAAHRRVEARFSGHRAGARAFAAQPAAALVRRAAAFHQGLAWLEAQPVATLAPAAVLERRAAATERLAHGRHDGLAAADADEADDEEDPGAHRVILPGRPLAQHALVHRHPFAVIERVAPTAVAGRASCRYE